MIRRRCLKFGANTPWYRMRWARGRGTRAAWLEGGEARSASAVSIASAPPGERRGVQVAEREVRIGDRRCVVALAVARRPRHRAGAAWTDPDRPRQVDRRDTAAAGADLGDVNDGDAQQVAATAHEAAAHRDRGADLVLTRAKHLARLDDRRFGGRTAHVEGDHVGKSGGVRDLGGGDDARRGTGLDDRHRCPGSSDRWDETAVRLHDVQRRRHAALTEPRAQHPEVTGDERRHVGVDDGRAGALELLCRRRLEISHA